MIWTLDDILKATGGTVVNEAPVSINGISLDSRHSAAGDLFLAFSGEQTDGHDYVEAAKKNGAIAALVARQVASSLVQIIVPDVLKALWQMGQTGRQRTDASIIAVTGSVGKTGTRDLMAACLARMGKTHASSGNYNNHIGAPLSLARMPADTEFGVFELGMDHAGEIAELSPLVAPDIAVITKIAESHIEFFDGLDGIARAKAEIFEGLKPDGLAILNADDEYTPLLITLAQKKKVGRVMTVGTYGDADGRIDHIEQFDGGFKVTARIDGAAIDFTLGMSAPHWIRSAVMGLVAVHHLGGDIAEAAAVLADHKELDGRGARYHLSVDEKAVILIDDSYNANPASMATGIAVLGDIVPAQNGRRIAVLADMLELGDKAEEYHRGLAEHITNANVEILICFGALMAGLAEELTLSEGLDIHHCENAEAALATLLSCLDDHDVVLVKGSHGMKAHHIAKSLKSLNQSEGGHHAA